MGVHVTLRRRIILRKSNEDADPLQRLLSARHERQGRSRTQAGYELAPPHRTPVQAIECRRLTGTENR
jgi:hypothetical protein